jgi:hypothetical protein
MTNDDDILREQAKYVKAAQEIADAEKAAQIALGHIDPATLPGMLRNIDQFNRDEEAVKQYQRHEEAVKQFQRDEEAALQFQREEEARRLQTQPHLDAHAPMFQPSNAREALAAFIRAEVKAEVARQLQERDGEAG